MAPASTSCASEMAMTAEQALARTLLLTRLHRLPDADDAALIRGFATTTVTIVADERNLRSAGAQAAVTTLVGLVAACGMRLRLVMPAIPVVGYQPPLLHEELTSALCDLAADSVPGAEAEVAVRSAPGDLVFAVGDSPWTGEADRAWRLAADPWVGRMRPVTAVVEPISTDFPIGALAAAAVAAAEPYRAGVSAASLRSHRPDGGWRNAHFRLRARRPGHDQRWCPDDGGTSRAAPSPGIDCGGPRLGAASA